MSSLYQALLDLDPAPGRHRRKHCPLGSGRTPGLAFGREDDLWIKCHDHGHTYWEVREALGFPKPEGAQEGPRIDPYAFGSAELNQEPPGAEEAGTGDPGRPGGEPDVIYQLHQLDDDRPLEKHRHDPEGKPKVIYTMPKGHPAPTRDGTGYWYAPLELPADGPVFVCEGEKVADALARAGMPVVSFGDAGRVPTPALARAAGLEGREIALAMDNDRPGRKWLPLMAVALEAVKCTVELLELAWPRGQDLADYVAPGVSARDLHDPSTPVDESLVAGLQGRPWAELLLPELLASEEMLHGPDVPPAPDVRLLSGIVLDQPGIVTAVVGQPGHGKSSLARHVALEQMAQGKRVLWLDYEGVYDTETMPSLRSLGARLEQLWIGAPITALPEDPHRWATMAQGVGADLVILDSIMFSLGGLDPLEAGTVSAWRRAARMLPCPTLAIGHTPKDGRATILGSQAWDAATRIRWEARRTGLGAYRLELVKGNILPVGTRLDLEVSYAAPEGALIAQEWPVSSQLVDPLQADTLQDRILVVLRQARVDADDDYLGMSRSAIREALAGTMEKVPALDTITKHADALVDDGRATRIVGKRGSRLYDLT